ncbi:hypothetical protein CSIM01_09284 [Colletotrichum simmondsii]|uniref:Uncharacterized protein n=1 Tax=Colletotrichum simmondsii TaxID=703756 RepID=A0A135RPK7_9PEZI|nr:hypothetical protein CSIM01_09284 [Colletotrichum simmondsii]
MFKNSEILRAREQQEEDRKILKEEVDLRGKQGQDTAKGEQVWYSRRVDDGCLVHWAIITHGQKYELRLPNGSVPKPREKVPESEKTISFEPARVYEARVAAWSLKEEMNKLRALKLSTPSKGYHTRDYTAVKGFQNSMQNGLWGVAAAGAGAGIMYSAYEAGKQMDPLRSGANAGGSLGPDCCCAGCYCCTCTAGDGSFWEFSGLLSKMDFV